MSQELEGLRNIYDTKYAPENLIKLPKINYGTKSINLYFWWDYWNSLSNKQDSLSPSLPIRLIIVSDLKENGKKVSLRYRHPVYRLLELYSKHDEASNVDYLSILSKENPYLTEEDLYGLAYIAYGEEGLEIANIYYSARHETTNVYFKDMKFFTNRYNGWIKNIRSQIKDDEATFDKIKKVQVQFDIIDQISNFIKVDLLDKHKNYLSIKDKRKQARYELRELSELDKPSRKEKERIVTLEQAIESYGKKLNAINNDITKKLGEIVNGKSDRFLFLKDRFNKVKNYDDLLDLYKHIDLERSEIELSRETYQFYPKYRGKVPKIEDGEDMFNQVILSSYVTSAQYIGEQPLLKVFGRSGGDKILIPGKVYERSKGHKSPLNKGVLSLRLWLGSDKTSKDYITASKDTFTTIIYDLNDNLFQVLITKKGIQNRDEIMKRIGAAMPFLSFEGHEIKSIKASYNIYNLEIIGPVFTDMLLTDDFMNSYLSSNEVSLPLMLKKAYEIYFKGQEKIDVHIVNNTLNRNLINVKLINDSTDTTENKTIQSGTKYINIIVTSKNKRDLNDFTKIFRLLMRYYYFRIPKIQKIYQAFGDTNNKGNIGVKVEAKAHEKLKQAFPDVFIKGYASLCTGRKQPIIIPPNEVADWEKQTFMKGGKTFYKQAMPFPPNKPLFYFGSGEGSEEYPFPRLTINTLKNKNKYPLLPCLGASDMMNRPGSNYDLWKKGDKITIKTQQGISTKINRLPDPYYEVITPTSIYKLVREAKNDDGEPIAHQQLTVLSVTRSLSSLIHCVFLAVKNKKYLTLKTDYEREIFVQEFRNTIAENINLNVTKQELYDRTEEQIKLEVSDPNVYFDPDLYYKTLEEHFGINIFNFEIPNDKSGYGEIAIPRHKSFYVGRKNPERSSVLIVTYKNKLVVPQSGIVILKDNNGALYTYGKKVTRMCINALKDRTKYYSRFNETPQLKEGNVVDYKTALYVSPNYFNILDHVRMTEMTQNIDSEGKTYIVSGKTKQGRISFYVPRTQPYALPLDDKLYPTTIEKANKALGIEPSLFEINLQNQVTGVWYPVNNVIQSIYVILDPFPQSELPDKYKELGATLCSDAKSRNQTNRIIKMRRDIEIIQQLLLWLYQGKYTEYTNTSAIEFISQHWVIDEDNSVKDSSNYYNFSNLPRDLSKYDKSLESLEELAPSLVQNGFIYFFNEAFYHRVSKAFLFKINSLRNLPTADGGTGEIANYYQSAQDFKSEENVTVLMGAKEINLWLKTSFNYQKDFYVNRLIPNNAPLLREPFIFEKYPGVFFLMQNTKKGGIREALGLCKEWENTINMGYDSTAKASKLPYVINGVESTGNIFLEEDYSKDNVDYYEILHYEGLGYKDEYAAMLRLY